MFTISKTKRAGLRSALAVSLVLAEVASAATYSVTTTNTSGSGSLALALSQAQSDADATINITSGPGLLFASNLPAIQNNLVINGNGNILSGSGSFRIFFVNATNKSVQINNLTLLDGVAQGGNGGAGYGGGGGGAGLGGAIFLNAGSLTVSSVAFSNNAARGGAGSMGADGGGGQLGGGGGGGGLDFPGGAGSFAIDGAYGSGGGGGALSSAGMNSLAADTNGGAGGGVYGGAGGLLALSGNAGNGASATLPDGGGGGGGGAEGATGNGGNGGNGADFSGGGGSGSAAVLVSGIPGNGGFGGGGGGGADAFSDAYSGGNGGFGGGGGGGGYGGDAGGAGGTGGFGAGSGAGEATGNAGGGLGAGGAIFARPGSFLTLQDCTFNGDTVVAGPAGGSPATAGSAIGQALFLGANVNFYVSSGTNTLDETIGGGNNVNALGNFTKSGPGTLVITNYNSYFGNTVVSNGTLEVVNNLLPSQNAIISSNGVLDYYYTNRVLGQGITYTGTGTLRVDGSGGGDVVFGPGAIYVDFSPGALIDVEGGELTGSSDYEGYWANNYASLNVASNALFDAVEAGFNNAMQIDALTGAGTFQGGYYGNANGGLTTLTIGIAGGSGTFSGKLLNDVNARLGIVKTGAGTEILSGTNNTYAGNTLVKGGTLIFNGSAGTGTVTVTNGTLAGAGIITGAVTVGTNGTFAPGNPTGTLTISNTLNLSGTTLITLNSGANSKVAGLTAVTYGGTLAITNIGSPLSVGNTFTLFSAAASTANFTTVGGNAGSGLAFRFNPANGVLTVASSTLPTTPTNLTYSAHSGSFTVNWPASYTGWILQAQTNSIAHGFGTNWASIPNSVSVNSMTFPIISTNCVFFRLQFPVP